MGLKFIENFPALILNNGILVVADLHFGLPILRDYEASISIINDDCNRLLKLIVENSVRELIIAGDVKESIGLKIPRGIVESINNCFKILLSKLNKITFVVGNHDGGLNSLLSSLEISFLRRIEILDKLKMEWFDRSNIFRCLIVHGHKKVLLEEIMEDMILISAHIHPGYRISFDGVSMVLKAWFLAKLRVRDLIFSWIVIPSFNSLIEGIPLNDLSNNQLKEFVPIKSDEIEILDKEFYLLDLTPLE